MKLNADELGRIADFFRAFSEPTRLALLQELKAGPRAVGELVEALPTTQANVSKQLKTLHTAGLVHRERDGVHVIYSIAEPVALELCRIACNKLSDAPRPRKLRF